MLTEATPLHPRWSIDSPLNRLPWTLPTALLICSVVLLALGYFMENPTRQQVAPLMIDAQFIEQSGSGATQNIGLGGSAGPYQSKPGSSALPQHAPSASPGNQHTKRNPPAQKLEVAPDTIVATPPAVAPGDVPATPSDGQAAAAVNLPANSDTQAGSRDEKGTSGGDMSANSGTGGGAGTGGEGVGLGTSGGGMYGSGGTQGGSGQGKGGSGGSMYASGGARAIIRPMPQIPDDLRGEAFNFAALARFHVAADGSAKVELAKPTPDPRLNRILLDSLKKWRFMPAIKNGKPVATTEEIVIRIEVK